MQVERDVNDKRNRAIERGNLLIPACVHLCPCETPYLPSEFIHVWR